MTKIPVSVIAVHVAEGSTVTRIPASPALAAQYKIIPLRILTRGGERIYVDRVLNIQREASFKAGGIGDKYTCTATLGEKQREIAVYRDDTDWFMEDDQELVHGAKRKPKADDFGEREGADFAMRDQEGERRRYCESGGYRKGNVLFVFSIQRGLHGPVDRRHFRQLFCAGRKDCVARRRGFKREYPSVFSHNF